jgi:hypothetical protein
MQHNFLTLRSKSHEGHYGTRHTTLWSCTHIPNIIDLSRKTRMYIVCLIFFFRFFSAKLVQTITFLSFQIGQLYLVCGCMTIRRCVTYHNDLCETLTFRDGEYRSPAPIPKQTPNVKYSSSNCSTNALEISPTKPDIWDS